MTDYKEILHILAQRFNQPLPIRDPKVTSAVPPTTEVIAMLNNEMNILMRKAGFIDSRACIEDIDYAPDRKVDRHCEKDLVSADNSVQMT